MADINIVGIDLISGQFRPVNSEDSATDTVGNSLQGASGLQGVTGVMGITGVLGGVGFTGALGPTGLRGITGHSPTGLASLNVTGLQGATGVDNTGITGITGLQGSGSYSYLTGPTTITTDAYIVGLDSTGGPFTVTLPSEVIAGKIYIFQDEGSMAGTNNITLTATTPPYLSFAYLSNSFTLTFNNQAVEVLNDTAVYWTNEFNIGYTGLQGITGVAIGVTGLAGTTGI